MASPRAGPRPRPRVPALRQNRSNAASASAADSPAPASTTASRASCPSLARDVTIPVTGGRPWTGTRWRRGCRGLSAASPRRPRPGRDRPRRSATSTSPGAPAADLRASWSSATGARAVRAPCPWRSEHEQVVDEPCQPLRGILLQVSRSVSGSDPCRAQTRRCRAARSPACAAHGTRRRGTAARIWRWATSSAASIRFSVSVSSATSPSVEAGGRRRAGSPARSRARGRPR